LSNPFARNDELSHSGADASDAWQGTLDKYALDQVRITMDGRADLRINSLPLRLKICFGRAALRRLRNRRVVALARVRAAA
jgi:hypothetical protein